MTRSTEVQIKSTSPELHIFIAYKLPSPRIESSLLQRRTLILDKPGWGEWRDRIDPIATLARGNKEGFTYVFLSGDQIVKNKIFQKVKTLTEEEKRGAEGSSNSEL